MRSFEAFGTCVTG